MSKINGIGLIASERQRQITKEGWTAGHDHTHDDGQLIEAANCYLNQTSYRWPWNMSWFKPTPDDRVRELVKAGALIAAEIDRIQWERP